MAETAGDEGGGDAGGGAAGAGPLDLGKWSAAFPLVRDLLSRPGTEPETNQRLRWMLTVGEQAMQEGNRAEALRAVQEAQPFLPHGGPLAEGFDKLQKQAGGDK